MIPGGGHVHPDANHFVLFGSGQWLIRDDGYQPKSTGQHNTLLVNGHGQLGEGAEWFDAGQALAVKARPRVLRAVSTPAMDQITSDAAEAYPRNLGLRRFVRHLIFVKPDVLIVADDILLDKEAPLELRFHPEQEAVRDGNVFLAKGKRATLRLEPLAAEGVQIAAGPMPLPGKRAMGNRASSPSVSARGGRRGGMPWPSPGLRRGRSRSASPCGRQATSGPSRSRIGR